MPVQQPSTFTVGNRPIMGKQRGSRHCVIKFGVNIPIYVILLARPMAIRRSEFLSSFVRL